MAILQRLGSFFATGLGLSGRRNKGPQQASAQANSTDSNVVVDESTALNVSAVWSAVRLIAESIGSLPIVGYQVDSNGKRKPAPNHPLSILFSGKPNRYQTTNEFLETLGLQEGLHGNTYCLIGRVNDDDVNSRIVSLLPLMADQMSVVLDDFGDIQYRYLEDGVLSVFPESRIWHVKSMGNGIVGLSPLAYARESIGLGIAADRRAAKFAKRGFKPAGVLMLDKLLTKEQRAAIRAEFADLAVSEDDPLRILEAGMTYQQVSLSPADSQLLETRKFQLQDIARFFGVPAVMIGETSSNTIWGSGIESIVEGWYRFGLRPRLERIEASINAKLLPVSERGRFVFEFSLEPLLRMNPTARSQRVKEHVQGGIITPNEGRIEMGYEPVTNPAADQLYAQAQMVPLGTSRVVATQGTPT